MRPVSLPRLLAVVLALATVPAQAGMFDGDALEAVAKLRKEHDVRLEKLDQAAQNQLEVANQLELLKTEVARLRGQVEMLTFELTQAQKRTQDYYVDLDNRLRKQETALASQTQAGEGGQAQKAPANPEAEAKDFEAGLNLFKAGKFKEAGESFGAFLSKYPDSSFAPSACYWGGNAYFQLREWNKAAELYSMLPQKWPTDAKAPDTLLQLSDVQKQLGNAKAAQATLEDLVARYPNSSAAGLAKQRLPKKKAH